MFPGHADEDRRLDRLLQLDDIAEDILEEYGIDMLELLTWPGEVQQEYFLIGHSTETTHNQSLEDLDEEQDSETDTQAAARESETTLDEYTDVGDPDKTDTADPDETGSENPDEPNGEDPDENAGESSSAISSEQPVSSGDDGKPDTRAQRIKEIVDDHFEGEIGTQICTIDLAPLGEMPVPTSRLLQPTNLSFDPVETSQKAATVELVKTLNEDRISFIHQCLLEPAGSSKSHDFLVTARLAPFGTGHGIVTEADLEKHLAADNQYRISEYVPGPATDNWALPIKPHRRYADQQSTHPSKLEQLDEMSLRDGSIEEVAVGCPDYRALLAGRVHNDDRYEQLFGAYGRIPISKADLPHFFTAVPAYFEVSSFGQLTTTDEPEITTEELGSESPGTRQSYGLELPGDTTAVTDDSDEESDRHKELVNKRIEFLLRHGHEIVAVDQDVIDVDIPDHDPTTTQYLDGESRPDIVSKTDGVVHFHEIEVANKTKPAALITNLARAAYHGHQVHIVTETRAEAKSKLWTTNPEAKEGPVSMPFKDTDEEWTVLYTQRKAVHRAADDVWYLLPRELSEATWRLTPDDRLQLVGPDGSILAEGDAEQSVDAFEYNTPRVRKEGDEWVLESASGEVLRRRSTKGAAASGYSFVRKPLVPTRFEYLENTTVEFQSNNGFTIFEKPPLWEQPQQSASIRYEEASKAFVELVTVEREGAEIPIPELRRRFKAWYTEQTDLKEPNETWFGRALRAYFEVDATDDHNKTLVDRRFRFSEGLVSPDLSFIEDEG
ncbi:hypothetical protein SAMN05444422_11198 [Halobiforma haloterrestris]|uniref:Uncharacterized protein n=1 Tax=Natronobacterium haloterrestre TaxID=148448 RepID=A0A1I1KF18_NATHA|nr:hypothetical protein SAMN05444422_11198 [Halobiforma haloterrestris]